MLKCKLGTSEAPADDIVFYTESISFAIYVCKNFGEPLYLYDYLKNEWELYHYYIWRD